MSSCAYLFKNMTLKFIVQCNRVEWVHWDSRGSGNCRCVLVSFIYIPIITRYDTLEGIVSRGHECIALLIVLCVARELNVLFIPLAK